MGDGWAVETTTDRDTGRAYTHIAYLTGPNGERLSVRVGQHDIRGTVAIAGTYPDGARDVYPDPKRISARARDDRPGQAIAREITRRVLPEYGPELSRVREAIARNGRARDARARTAAELATLAGGRVSAEGAEVTVRAGEVWGRINVDHDGTGGRIELHSLTTEQLRAVLRAVATTKGAGE